MTDSLTVAEVFGKHHHHVIRDIELLDCSEEFRALNFRVAHKLQQAGSAARELKRYTMTRDGFTFLAMGFTGDKALKFKTVPTSERFSLAFPENSHSLYGLISPWSQQRPVTIQKPLS